MSITKFNKREMIFTNTEKFEEFRTLEDLFQVNGEQEKYLVTGLYTYKSSYGDGCFLKTNGYNISLPSHMVETVEEIRRDEESVNQINSGKVYIEIYSYTLPEKYPNKVFYSVNFVV